MLKAGIALVSRQRNIKIEQNVILYYNNKVGKVCDGKAIVDCMFERSDLAEFLKKSRLEVSWEIGIYDSLKQHDSIQSNTVGHEFHVKVYRLKEDADPLLRYLSLNRLQDLHLDVDLNNYDILYDDTLRIMSLDDVCDYLENQPAQQKKILNVSDIIAVDIEGWNYYYIDRRSYQQIDVNCPIMEMDMCI